MKRLALGAVAKPSVDPVIDDVTLRTVRAMRLATEPRLWTNGVTSCVCGARSLLSEVILPNGWSAPRLAVHFVAYHRSEVSMDVLDAIRTLPAGSDPPMDHELVTPELRSPPNHTLAAHVDDISHESPNSEVLLWTYAVTFHNHATVAARLIAADITLSVAGVYGDPTPLAIHQVIPAGEHGDAVRHVAEFRLAELGRGRSAAIAASLSLSSVVSANWEVHGEREDGTAIRENITAVARA